MKNKYFFLIFSLIIVSFICLSANIEQPADQKKDLGVGPIKSVTIGPLDTKMAGQGKTIFNNTCAICHDLDQQKIGPPLRNIAKDRAPEFIMNLLLNTADMQKKDPYIKGLIVKFNNIVMTDPGLNKDQARSVLEYLRSVAK
jgi:cytochrome c551/c552